MMISIVIPVFNEERYVAECLQSLVAQTLPMECFEVIVVDNGSTDSTMKIVNSFRDLLPLEVLLRPGCSISAVRNHGALVAKGDILAFMDGDCLGRPTWLADSLAIAPPHSIWGAHYIVSEEASWVAKVWSKYQATEREGAVTFIPGGCLFITRADFKLIGGFRESVETSEDVEICARAREQGMQILAYPSLAVVHKGTPGTLGKFYRKNRWHGKHVLRLFLARLPSTRNLPIVAISVYTLMMFWAAIILPVVA